MNPRSEIEDYERKKRRIKVLGNLMMTFGFFLMLPMIPFFIVGLAVKGLGWMAPLGVGLLFIAGGIVLWSTIYDRHAMKRLSEEKSAYRSSNHDFDQPSSSMG